MLGAPNVPAWECCRLQSKLHTAPHGEHIVMIGDSLTRYQWLALAIGLRQGCAWERPPKGTPHNFTNEPHYEGTWMGGWNIFFRGTTSMLGPTAMCDCYRDDHCCKHHSSAVKSGHLQGSPCSSFARGRVTSCQYGKTGTRLSQVSISVPFSSSGGIL